MDDKKVAIPLMVRSEDDIQFVEEDNDTISENEQSTGAKTEKQPSLIVHHEHSSQHSEHVYHEIPQKKVSTHSLGIPKLTFSRSFSSDGSSDGALPTLVRSASGKKKLHHDYEKVSVMSSSSKRNAIERFTDGSFFRRRHETLEIRRSDKTDDDEHILEALRHVVRKCTAIDPVKRPASTDVMDLLSTFNEKS